MTFHIILGIVTPTDELIFVQRCSYTNQPDNVHSSFHWWNLQNIQRLCKEKIGQRLQNWYPQGISHWYKKRWWGTMISQWYPTDIYIYTYKRPAFFMVQPAFFCRAGLVVPEGWRIEYGPRGKSQQAQRLGVLPWNGLHGIHGMDQLVPLLDFTNLSSINFYPVVRRERFGARGIHIPYIFPIQWGASWSYESSFPTI